MVPRGKEKGDANISGEINQAGRHFVVLHQGEPAKGVGSVYLDSIDFLIGYPRDLDSIPVHEFCNQAPLLISQPFAVDRAATHAAVQDMAFQRRLKRNFIV